MGKMEELDISQMPVFEDGEPMGSITEDNLVTLVLQGYDLRHTKVRDVMESSFPIVEPVTPDQSDQRPAARRHARRVCPNGRWI